MQLITRPAPAPADSPVSPIVSRPRQRHGRAWLASRVVAVAIGVFLLALLPRFGNVAVYVTADEGNWMERTALFATALERGDAAGTYLTGHPGVMTMWAGVLGMGFDRAAYLATNLAAGNISADQPAYFDALVRGRIPIMLLTCLLTAAVALLGWRLFGAPVGLLAGALLALEPFWAAHSLVLHTDASLTTYMCVSILAALVFFWRGGGPGYLLLSAVCAGLTVLAKTPGVFVFLFVPFAAGLALLADPARHLRPASYLRLAALLVGWGLIAVAVMLVVWPALRADPLGTITKMATFTEDTGGSDHANYFLEESTGAPSALYYPVTLAFRLSPITALGLLLAAVALAWRVPRRDVRGLGVPLMLVAFGVLFMVMMDLAPKKFDRYLLPTYPALALLSALGFWWTLRRLRPHVGLTPVAAGLGVLLLAHLWQVAGARPYYMAYYNPLLGGAPAARNAIVVGWGEGMDVVARHLDSLPNADSLTVATFYNSVFAAQFPGTIMSPNTYQPVSADYALLYVNVSQRSLADRLRAAIRQRDPYMSVKINGLEFVTAYRIEDTNVGDAVPSGFGERVTLERYRLGDGFTQPGAPGEGLLRWRLTAPSDHPLTSRISMVRLDGWVAYRMDVPLADADQQPVSRWKVGQEAVLSYRYVVPTDLPKGRYRIVLEVRDAVTGATLPISQVPSDQPPPLGGYANGVALATVQRF